MTNNERHLVIIGAGSLGVMTLDAALEMNKYHSIYFIDDEKEKESTVKGIKVLGGVSKLKELNEKKYDFVIAISNNQVRKKIAETYKINYVNIVHPKVSISRFAKLNGIGNIFLSHTSIDPNVEINNHVIINKNNSVGHDSILENYSQISPGSSLGGFTRLHEGVFVGLGSVTIPQISIGKFSTVGAGAVVTRDVKPRVTVVGVPAKAL